MTELEKGIRYEVALEVLGQGRQPFLNAIVEERKKASPSEAFIQYCKMRLNAITELQENLRARDTETIDRILDPNAELQVR